jgi:hypothetical protein
VPLLMHVFVAREMFRRAHAPVESSQPNNPNVTGHPLYAESCRQVLVRNWVAMRQNWKSPL